MSPVYFLIIFAYVGQYASIESVPFYSESHCYAAQEKIEKTLPQFKAICIKAK